jgi:antitoxin ParD1/3/4
MDETLTILVPESLKEFVEAQLGENGYNTPSDYVCALIREDRKRKAEEKLEALLIEGLESGPPIEVTPEFWEEKRARLLERYGNKERA